jgi:HAMP domain-containing protein
MAANLTVQLRDVSKVATAIAMGDLTQKITVDVRGEILQIKNVINTMVDQLSSFARKSPGWPARSYRRGTRRAGRREGRSRHVERPDRLGELDGRQPHGQVRNIAPVTTAVANGDLSKKITVPVKGEILELKNTINTMVDQLNSFASEVTRVAREVGTEGKLGGQAE